MTAGFSLRKIKTDPTLGQKLKRARARKKISLLDAEMETKIRGKFLEALEEDDWKNLPADAYTKGFVLRYAKYLGLDEKKILEKYQKEKNIRFSKEEGNILPQRNIKEMKFLLTPRLFVPVLISTFIIAVFGYIVYQVYGFAGAPELQVISPNDNAVFDKDVIEITGVTDTSAKVYVNKDQIQVSSDGQFATEYKLQKGVNVIEVKSQGKTNKEKALTYTVEYKPVTAEAIPIRVSN
ncbi:MAG: helix-turn-helix domain-containing protein [Patescibacteria group bacterium]